MNSFEKTVLYILSFLLYPIGIITWVISLFSKDLEKKKVGRICLYISLVSFVLFLILGIATFLMTTTFNIDLDHTNSIEYQINDGE
ncbi:hypothetical protein [Bacillus toyonensis]|uniref:Group-specific protein n=1 Tax=Bacillus toyonensis TaxID=155322 RepID=A0A2C4R343_9BACI|nr:hypothetical protein [Bacillus toyonensis]PGB02109.1 hypothetical protein COL93_13325 [Bacillus toyonensis]PHD71008.1 hypothetical protein COF40_09540 [Bacillus toyonensis]